MKIEQPWYLETCDGQIRFTEIGMTELGPYLAKAGIDIKTIKTRSEYQQARLQAQPYFMEHLKQIACSGKQTLEREALQAVLKDDDELLQKLLKKLQKKKLWKTSSQ